MIKILKRRVLSDSMLPVRYPQLEDYDVLGIYQIDGQEAANEAFERFKNDHDNALAQNNSNFNNAKKWMNQCAMWHGFTHFVNGENIVKNIQHQDWCPAPYWYDFHENNKNSWKY